MNALTRWDPFKEMEETQNRKETARKPRKHDPNFAQSRDIREDRGERQMKAARARQTLPHLTRGR